METYEFYVAGVQFHDLKTCIGEIKEGDQLNLENDPENIYDSNAVKIQYCRETSDGVESIMTGFVPKKFSASVTAAMIIAEQKCVVTQLNPSAKHWEQLKVRIKEVENDEA
jgi:hypothetical protein